jgi:hypothetical protein
MKLLLNDTFSLKREAEQLEFSEGVVQAASASSSASRGVFKLSRPYQ